MKRKLQNIAYLLMAAALVTSCGGKKQTSEFPDWAWADFQRPEGINPIISPDTTTFFYCPMRQDSVAWEASDTFNPAATVYNGKVVVLKLYFSPVWVNLPASLTTSIIQAGKVLMPI